jgi:ribose-phosphate pyrophosphokinase
MTAPLLFSTESYEPLAAELIQQGGFEPGTIERRTFPDGERYRRIVSDVSGRECIVLAGTISDADTLELYDVACAMVYYGARTLTLVIPYYGYSTMERAVRDGEVVTAKARARLLSSIPTASLGNRVLLMDLHVSGIAHYFEGQMHPVHVYAKSVIKAAAKRVGGEDFVLACTDAGRAKWVESLANDIGVTVAFVYKRRLSGSKTEVTGVSAHVAGKVVVIYDDMIRTGSSLIGAAEAYKQAGATRIAAIATHGLFPGDALDRLRATGLFSSIVCTDSHPRSVELQNDFLQVDSVASVLAEHLQEVP